MAFTKQEVRQLASLYSNGVSQRQIAEAMGKTLGSVSGKIRRMKSSGELPPSPPGQPSENTLPAVLAQNVSLRRRLKKFEEQLGNWELLVSEFVANATELNMPRAPALKAAPSRANKEMVLLLSDSHAASAWTSEKTDGFSSYSYERFCDHLWYLAQEIIRLVGEDRSKYGLKILHIDMLGDIIQGTLRLEDEVCNDFEVVPCIVQVCKILFQFISTLSAHFEEIVISCVAGNHGRIHNKPQAKRYVETNYDTLVYLTLKELAAAAGAADRIRIRVPKSRVWSFKRLGHSIKIAHGDHVRGGNGISQIPIYGLSRDMLRQFRKEIKHNRGSGVDLYEMGHFHNFSFLENCLLINGAFCPTDPWAYHELGAATDPTQTVYYTSPDFCIGWNCPLSLKHAPTSNGFFYDPNLFEEIFEYE